MSELCLLSAAGQPAIVSTMRFKDDYVSKDHRYSLGTDELTGMKYLSIPVSNSKVDYEEYYEINPREFETLLRNPELAINLAEKCRRRENDESLILKPGAEHGSP